MVRYVPTGSRLVTYLCVVGCVEELIVLDLLHVYSAAPGAKIGTVKPQSGLLCCVPVRVVLFERGTYQSWTCVTSDSVLSFAWMQAFTRP